MTLQTEARLVSSEEASEPRFGFTLTKKVGNAVVRNRARRRLREAVRLTPDLPAQAGQDYVIVGRIASIRLPFQALIDELADGLVAVHQRGKRREGRRSMEAGSGDAVLEDSKRSNPTPINANSPGRSTPERIRPAP